MHSWIARLLLLVMLGPSFGQLAMAHAAQPDGMHCMRKLVQPTMQCHHHGMIMAPQRQSSEASFQALAQCCQNHDCCCRVAVRQWAQPQARPLSLCLLIERFRAPLCVVLASAGVAGYDSARAPPRS